MRHLHESVCVRVWGGGGGGSPLGVHVIKKCHKGWSDFILVMNRGFVLTFWGEYTLGRGGGGCVSSVDILKVVHGSIGSC